MADGNNEGRQSKLILFIGKDKSYWTTLQQRYASKYSDLGFLFEQTDVTEAKLYSQVFLEVLEKDPLVIYMDFTSELKSKIKLTQLIHRENSLSQVPVIGLVNKKSDVKKCLAAGAEVVHVKCAEYHDVIYDAVFLADQNAARSDQYAVAKTSDETKLIDDFRIGFITPTYIHAEGNLELEKGQVIELRSQIPKEIIPSRNFIVKDIRTENLYYDFKYGYDLEFVFVDEPEFDVDADEHIELQNAETEQEKKKIQDKMKAQKQELEAEYQNALTQSRKKARSWVLDNSLSSQQKNTKILIVDRALKVVGEADKPLDSYPFALRLQTYLTEDFKTINLFRPDVIMFQYTPYNIPEMMASFETQEERDDFKNTVDEFAKETSQEIQNAIAFVKSLEDYNPLFVVFNCEDFTSQSMQQNFSYPQVMVRKEMMDLKTVVDLGAVFEKNQKQKHEKAMQEKILALRKKDPMKYGRLTPSDFEEKKYYISKSSDLSFASKAHDVTLLSLSESEVVIGSEMELELKTYRLKIPIEMSVRLVPDGDKLYTEESGVKMYKGLIHSVGEEDKKELRRQVNEVFCAPAAEAREKELQEFQQLNQKKSEELQAATAALESSAAAELGLNEDDGEDVQIKQEALEPAIKDVDS